MLIVLLKIKLESKIGVLSQVKPIPFILGKVGTLNILASLINGIIIYFFKWGTILNDKIDILKIQI